MRETNATSDKPNKQEKDMPQTHIEKSAAGGVIALGAMPRSPADAAMAALDRLDEAGLDGLLRAQGQDPKSLLDDTRAMAAEFRDLLQAAAPARSAPLVMSQLEDEPTIESIRFFEECVAAGSPQWNGGSAGGRSLAASDMFGKHDWRKMFTTRVRGASMTPDGIHDGDVVLVDPTVEAREGDIVVAYVEGQGQVVKRLRVDADGIVLESSNTDFAPIRVKSWTELAIQGVVRGRAGKI